MYNAPRRCRSGRSEGTRAAPCGAKGWILQTSHANSTKRAQANADDAAVDAIARETAAPADIVKTLYEEETARLDAQARLKQFVPVIAINRVKQRLRKLTQRHR
jgi:Protein of unknown function (DUF3562)